MRYYRSGGVCSAHRENEKFIQTLREEPQGKRAALQNVSRQYANLNTTHTHTHTHIYIYKVNQSHYRPEVPRGFQEVKVPRLRDNGPEWW